MHESSLKKGQLIKNFSFYKSLLLITIPVMLQNLIVQLTQMVDTIMLGELNEVILSAASLGNQPFFIFSMLTFGIGSGGVVLTSQYWGKGNTDPVKTIVTFLIKFTTIAGIIFSAIVFIFPENVLSIYTKDPAVIAEGVKYLRIVCFVYPILGFSSSYYTSLRGIETVIVATVSNVIALCVNIALNYCLIYGNFGFPQLGIQGAAIATLSARGVELIIAIIHMIFIDKKLNLKLKDFLRKDTLLIKDLLKISSPVMLNEALWGMGFSMQAAILGNVSTIAVAANSIISVIQQLSAVAVFGLGNAAAILIGKSIGEGNIQEAKNRGFTINIISVGVGVCAFSLILFAKTFAIDFYNVSEATKELAHQMIYVSATIVFFLSIGATGVIGTLRGGGDTKMALFIDICTLWLISLPLAYTAANVFKLSPVFVYMILKFDEPVKATLYLLRFRTYKWINDVTR